MTRTLLATGASISLLSCTTTSTFDATDTNDDGRISTGEVEVLLINSIFKADDANGDGRVTLDEWKKANPNDDAALFTARDTNGDGVVTLDELSAHAKKTGMFDKFIDQLDVDDDGTVSASDVNAFITKHNLEG
jgi:Ca2+-binding EF-hand superfamily protein